jgi:hypothetical protein
MLYRRRKLYGRVKNTLHCLATMPLADILHHFGRHDWLPWIDINDGTATTWHWNQKQYCRICNIGRRRWTDSKNIR